MHLTLYADYSLRVLQYLALRKDQLVTISELANYHKVSRNHLVKVVHNLGILGYIFTTRGRNGGIRLACPANEIVIGDVVRRMEPDYDFLKCFSVATDHCIITHSCVLKEVLVGARNDFLGTLDKYTVEDAIKNSSHELPPPLDF